MKCELKIRGDAVAIAIIRTVILFTAVVAALRIMGKRQLGELEPAELVVAVMISDLASHPLQDVGTPLLYGLIPVLTLLCIEILLSAGMNRSPRFRSAVCGRPSMLIHNGKIVQSQMRKNRFTVDELAEELRKKDVLDISAVKYAILETDGTLSTILEAEYSPLTPKAMAMQVEDRGYPVIIINDGRIMDDNLQLIGRDERWLEAQLKQRKISSPEDVYIMNADSSGNIYFAVKEG